MKVREVMHESIETIGENATILEVAKKMSRLNIGALVIRGEDDGYLGMVTDRDLVVRVLAEEEDPSAMLIGELPRRELVTVEADADVDEALQRMADAGVRRLPVVENDKFVGMLSQGDLALRVEHGKVGDLLAELAASRRRR